MQAVRDRIGPGPEIRTVFERVPFAPRTASHAARVAANEQNQSRLPDWPADVEEGGRTERVLGGFQFAKFRWKFVPSEKSRTSACRGAMQLL